MAQWNAITLKQLRALAAISERGSITGAADLLNLSVPAVSTQLKLLEANIGAQLFVRAAGFWCARSAPARRRSAKKSSSFWSVKQKIICRNCPGGRTRQNRPERLQQTRRSFFFRKKACGSPAVVFMTFEKKTRTRGTRWRHF